MAKKLSVSGLNLLMDAHPSPFYKVLGYGKDAFETVEASLQLMDRCPSVISAGKDSNPKGFAKALRTFLAQIGHDVMAYGPDVAMWAKNTGNVFGVMGRDNVSLSDLSKLSPDKLSNLEKNLLAFASEAYDLEVEENMFCDNIITKLFSEGKKQGLNVGITFKDVGGDRYPMVILTDEKTGEVRMGYTFDSNGNVIMLPGQGGITKTVTVLNKKNKVVKKTIIVNPNDTTIVECGLDDEDTIMEENPEHGYLMLDTKKMEFYANGGTLKTMIVTNYLNYSCTTKDNWIKCSIPNDLNQMTVTVIPNDTTIDRKGKVTVAVTDSKGKVLDTVVLPVEQKGKEPDAEDFVKAEPSSVEFDANKGTKNVEVTLANGLRNWSAYVEDESIGWLSAEPYEYVETEGLWKGVGHQMIKISVNPNTTGEERRGVITVIASRKNDVYAAEKTGEIVKTNIMVIQKAGEEETEIRTDVKSLDIIFSVHTAGFYNSDNMERGEYYIYEDFQVSKSGKTLTITGKKRDSKFDGADNVTFSLTVDFSTPKAPVVTNFELQSNGYRTHGWRENTNVDWSLKASYIPLEKIWNYSGTTENYIFRATEADGLKVTSYSRSEEYYETDDKKSVKNLSLSSNPENVIDITISYP